MEPTTLVLIGTGLFGAYERLQKWRHDKEQKRLRPPVKFTEEQLKRFTNATEGARVFCADVERNVIAPCLPLRSVEVIQDPDLARLGLGQAYRLVPLERGRPTAADVITHGRTAGASVLGSLSLVYIGLAPPCEMIILVGSPAARALAAPGQDFAILSRAPEPKPKPLADIVQALTPEVMPAPPKHANGKPTPKPKPIVETVGEVAKES